VLDKDFFPTITERPDRRTREIVGSLGRSRHSEQAISQVCPAPCRSSLYTRLCIALIVLLIKLFNLRSDLLTDIAKVAAETRRR
jgi:hypothetical protein